MSSSLAGLMVFAAFIFGILLGKDIEADKREARREELSEKVRAKLRNRKAAIKQLQRSVAWHKGVRLEELLRLRRIAAEFVAHEATHDCPPKHRGLQMDLQRQALGGQAGGRQATGGAGGHSNA